MRSVDAVQWRKQEFSHHSMAENIAEDLGAAMVLPPKQVLHLGKTALAAITRELLRVGKVKIPGFGTFTKGGTRITFRATLEFKRKVYLPRI